MLVDEAILDLEVGDEEENLQAYAGLTPEQTALAKSFSEARWSSPYLARAVLPALPSGPVRDEGAGDVLPPRLVAAAREEEVSAMEE